MTGLNYYYYYYVGSHYWGPIGQRCDGRWNPKRIDTRFAGQFSNPISFNVSFSLFLQSEFSVQRGCHDYFSLLFTALDNGPVKILLAN